MRKTRIESNCQMYSWALHRKLYTDRRCCSSEMSWQRVTVHWNLQCAVETRVTVKLNNCLLWNTESASPEGTAVIYLHVSKTPLLFMALMSRVSPSHLSYNETNTRPQHSNLSEAISHSIMPLYQMMNWHFQCWYGWEMLWYCTISDLTKNK